MAFTPVLCTQLAISLSAIFFNSLGIYCIRVRKKGNRNQLLLQQNLAWIDIVKTIYDYVPWVIYHFKEDWYTKSLVYLVTVEINMMTLMFCSVILITLDRFLCIVLDLNYSKYVNIERTTSVVISLWIISMTPGPILWAIFSQDVNNVKMYYYIIFDAAIILLIVSTYTIIIQSIQERNERLSIGGGRMEKLRMQAVAVALMISFILCNGVPDMIYTFHTDNQSIYDVISILWSLGYLFDPLIYIFTTQEMRRIAKIGLVNLICCRSASLGEKSGRETQNTNNEIFAEAEYCSCTATWGKRIFARFANVASNITKSPSAILSTAASNIKIQGSSILSINRSCEKKNGFLAVPIRLEIYRSTGSSTKDSQQRYSNFTSLPLTSSFPSAMEQMDNIPKRQTSAASINFACDNRNKRSRSLPCIWNLQHLIQIKNAYQN